MSKPLRFCIYYIQGGLHVIKFGERLRELRIEKGLSAIKLGKALGVGDTTILRWESSRMLPTIDRLYDVCKFFGVTADYMIGLED